MSGILLNAPWCRVISYQMIMVTHRTSSMVESVVRDRRLLRMQGVRGLAREEAIEKAGRMQGVITIFLIDA
jgi:hypothetical protein